MTCEKTCLAFSSEAIFISLFEKGKELIYHISRQNKGTSFYEKGKEEKERGKKEFKISIYKIIIYIYFFLFLSPSLLKRTQKAIFIYGCA